LLESRQMHHQTNCSSVINAVNDVQIAEASIVARKCQASKNSRLMAG